MSSSSGSDRGSPVDEQSKTESNDDDDDSRCPHCSKVFTTQKRLETHVNNFVCRPQLRPVKKGTSTKKKKPKKTKVQTDERAEEVATDTEAKADSNDEIKAEEEQAEETGSPYSFRRRLRSRETPKKSPRSGSKRTRKVKTEESAPSSSGSSKESSDEEEARPKKRTKDASTSEKRTCPHCQKVFSVKLGLDYHVKNFVCRPSLRPGGPVQKGKRKVPKSDDGVARKTYKRFRGALKDRTCNSCKRVFSSVLGLKYHQENRVCVIKSRAGIPFHSLSPGDRFVTNFGVVEVIEDTRKLPVAKFPSNIKEVEKKWKNTKLKRDQKLASSLIPATAKNMARRFRLNDLYMNKKLTQASVFNAYFGTDPRKVYLGEWKRMLPAVDSLGPDPSEPEESYPDRIVVCKFVPDRRKLGSLEEDDSDQEEVEASSTMEVMGGARLFLRRSMLKEEYMESMEIYKCADCGSNFLSATGYKYHVKSEVCRQTKKKAKAAAEERLAAIESKARRRMQQDVPASLPKISARPTIRKNKAKDSPIYPQVLLALGFHVLPKTEKWLTLSAFRPIGAPRSFGKRKQRSNLQPDTSDEEGKEPPQPMTLTQYVRQDEETASAKVAQAKLVKKPDVIVSPHDTLTQLYAQLKFEQSRFLLGPVYDPVFSALGFRKAKKKKKAPPKKKTVIVKQTIKVPPPKKKSRTKKGRTDRAKKGRTESIASPLPQKPLPPIVDVQVLVGEIDAGRYPSMKRVPVDDASRCNKCSICKDKWATNGALLCCTICPQVFHLKCMRTRYTVKDPEPGDEMLCQNCIGQLHSRRVRAEKRRLEKNNDDDNWTAENIKENALEEMRLAKGVVQGREHESVAAQARRVNDVTELLRDAEVRLSNRVETSKINSLRCEMIAPFESKALF